MICFFVFNPSKKQYLGDQGQFVSTYKKAHTWPTYRYLQTFLEDTVRYAQMNKMEWYANAYICKIQDENKTVYQPILNLLWHEYYLLKENSEYSFPLFKEHQTEIYDLLKSIEPKAISKVTVPNIW